MSKPVAAKQVACPNCRKAVAWNKESTWRPFCSERCRLIDLGEWFQEEHSIAGSTTTPFDESNKD